MMKIHHRRLNEKVKLQARREGHLEYFWIRTKKTNWVRVSRREDQRGEGGRGASMKGKGSGGELPGNGKQSKAL